MKEFEKIVRYTQRGESDMYDVVEVGDVVRCKDCKWRLTIKGGKCVAYDAFWNLGDDGFCSVGERLVVKNDN